MKLRQVLLYRTANGNTVLHQGSVEPRQIAKSFNREQTLQALKDTQEGKTDYPAFMKGIAGAGARFYEATLAGNKKRVAYIGHGEIYEEKIPFN